MNGDVVPCCYLSNYKCKAVMGNIAKEPLSEIWNSNKYQELRRSAFKGYPDFCDVASGGCKAKTNFLPNVKLNLQAGHRILP
jgi:radical SAM protein with 4Fe4S-binding SPASM domain